MNPSRGLSYGDGNIDDDGGDDDDVCHGDGAVVVMVMNFNIRSLL